MGCASSVSNYQRKKIQMIGENQWKSNFINIWEQYGVNKWVDGVLCFDYFRIDGPGEGQEKMSKHLKHPDLWQEVQDDDLEWVHFYFKLQSLVSITESNIAAWLAGYKSELSTYTFAKMRVVGVNGSLTEYKFYSAAYTVADESHCTNNEPDYLLIDGVCHHVVYTAIEDDFLTRLAELIGMRYLQSYTDFVREADDISTVYAYMNYLDDHSGSWDTGNLLFILNYIQDVIAEWLMLNGIGTTELDELVLSGKLIGLGDVGSGTMTYALPVQTAREMGGSSFVSIVGSSLNFDYKEETSWFDYFMSIVKVVLAGVAIYFQQYWLAASLFVSAAADVTGSKELRILSTVLSIYAMDITSLQAVGVGEAAKLLSNVYGLYTELAYKPETGNQEEPVDKEQEMYYKAPYDAYSQLYCYKDMISVSVR